MLLPGSVNTALACAMNKRKMMMLNIITWKLPHKLPVIVCRTIHLNMMNMLMMNMMNKLTLTGSEFWFLTWQQHSQRIKLLHKSWWCRRIHRDPSEILPWCGILIKIFWNSLSLWGFFLSRIYAFSLSFWIINLK